MYFYIMVIFLALFVSFIFRILIHNMIVQSGFLKQNFKGDPIPIGMGIVFPVGLISTLTLLHLLFPLKDISLLFSFGVVSMAFLGIIDDLLGNRDTTGLRGHIGKLLRFKLTTGGLKAFMGGVISIFVSLPFSSSFWLLILNSFILALFTNLINLLDLRPGRALKFFLFYAILLLIFSNPDNNYLLIIVIIIALVYFPLDIKSLAMMGDVGSNSLGFVLGFFTISYFASLCKLVVLILLVLTHIFSEKYSITNFIEKNKFLKDLDDLGR